MRVFSYLFSSSLKRNDITNLITGGVFVETEFSNEQESLIDFGVSKFIKSMVSSKEEIKEEENEKKERGKRVRRASHLDSLLYTNKRSSDEFMYVLVNFLGAMLTSPEDSITEQSHRDQRQMYFII